VDDGVGDGVGGAEVGGEVVGVTVLSDGAGVGVMEGDGDGETVVAFEEGITLGAGDTVVSFPYNEYSSTGVSSHAALTTT